MNVGICVLLTCVTVFLTPKFVLFDLPCITGSININIFHTVFLFIRSYFQGFWTSVSKTAPALELFQRRPGLNPHFTLFVQACNVESQVNLDTSRRQRGEEAGTELWDIVSYILEYSHKRLGGSFFFHRQGIIFQKAAMLINTAVQTLNLAQTIQGVPGGKVNILRGHSIGHSKQNTLYEHVSCSERFPRQSHLTVQCFGLGAQYCPSLPPCCATV